MTSTQTAPAHHDSSSRLHDIEGRQHKAAKILAVLQDAATYPPCQSTLLDVGCSYGYITSALTPRVKHCIGVEYDGSALEASDSTLFVHGDATQLPIADARVDIVVCAQVYEHTSDANAMFAEIWRVLRPGGICFFSGPNRAFPYEYHYHLPFVHWFPPRVAAWMLRMLHPGAEHDVRSKTLWGLRRSLRRFEIKDYTIDMIRQPARFQTEEEMGKLRWLGRLPHPLLRCFLPFVPNFNWILVKTAIW